MTESSAIAQEWSPSTNLPETFVSLPRYIYRGDPNWIPENPQALKDTFSTKNPYFDKNKTFLICNDTLRMVGFYNPELLIEGEPSVFFGYWETQNNLEENRKAFNLLEEWAQELGTNRIYGPINFTTFGDYRLRIDSFDHPQFLGEPYNPKYYPQLLGQLGYEIKYKYFTACCTTETLMLNAQRQLPALEKRAGDAGIRVIPLTPEYWMDNLEQLYPIADSVFSENFAYSPIPYQLFQHYCGEKFARKFCPVMSNVALKDDKIAAFHLFYPDYSPLTTQANENPINPDDLVYGKHFEKLPEPKTFLGKTVGVLPEFRSLGLFFHLGFNGTMKAKDIYQYGYGAMVREDNRSGAIKRFSKHSYQYALFTKEI